MFFITCSLRRSPFDVSINLSMCVSLPSAKAYKYQKSKKIGSFDSVISSSSSIVVVNDILIYFSVSSRSTSCRRLPLSAICAALLSLKSFVIVIVQKDCKVHFVRLIPVAPN